MAPAAVIALSTGRGGGPALRVLNDRRLARLASKGDPRAFAAIYERHHQDLFRYCRSITGNAEDAGDALQSTMAAALRALRGERREIALRPWLFRIAHNESVSLVRRRRPSTQLTEASTPSTPGPHTTACMRERVSALVADMRELPERQRGALVMRELNGLDYGEISEVLHISGGAARQAVYEARLALTALDEGRDMECDSVRRYVSARDGRVLRGRRLRAHLRGCRGCTDFSEQMELRSSALSSLLPPLPAAVAAGIFGGLVSGGAGLGVGASVGAAAGAGSGGVMSLVVGGVSQAAGASAAAKGAAAAVAVAVVAGVGTVEVAREVERPAPGPQAAVAQAPDKPRLKLPPKSVPRSPGLAAPNAPARGGPGAAGDPRGTPRDPGEPSDLPRPVRRAPRVPHAPVELPVSAPVAAPRVPQAALPPPPVSRPAAPVPPSGQQQYADGMRQVQLSMQIGAQVYQQSMQGVQQMMSNLFPSSPR